MRLPPSERLVYHTPNCRQAESAPGFARFSPVEEAHVSSWIVTPARPVSGVGERWEGSGARVLERLGERVHRNTRYPAASARRIISRIGS